MTITAEFQIQYTRFLNPQGELIAPLPVICSHELLLQLYRDMLLTRVFDAKAIALQRTGQMGTYPSMLGQEAIQAAVGRAMLSTDVLCPSYREAGIQCIRGVELSDILTYWGGDERGSAAPGYGEDFPMAVPIATQCLHAAGVATAFKIRQQARAVVTVCGDGGTSEGDFYEALNIAGAWQLPVVFLVINNQWAISMPRSAQSQAKTLAQKAIAAGFSGEQVDGNDVIAVYEVCQKALQKARTGGGPSLIEAVTYRLGDHTTADDASRYRDRNELAQAWKEEPISRLRTYLVQAGVWSEPQELQLQKEIKEKVEQAVAQYLNQERPSIESMFDYQYASLPKGLQEQRAYALALKED